MFPKFLLFISNFTPLWSEHILYDFNPFTLIEGFKVWPSLWSILNNVSWHLKRMCILLLLGGVFYRCLLGRVGIGLFESSFLVDFLLSCSIHYWKSGTEVSKLLLNYLFLPSIL